MVNMPARINAEDLPADLRKQLGITITKTKKSGRSETGEVHVRCVTCEIEFHFTKGPHGYEHHQETTGHCRFANVLEFA